MKKTLIALILILFFSTPVLSDEWFPSWTKEEILLQSAALALKTIDYGQTRYISQHPEYHEMNPLMSSHPSLDEVNQYFLITAILQVAIAYALPHKWRKYWIGTQILVSGGFVLYNSSVGIGIAF